MASQTDDDVLDEPLRTKADRQAKHRRARQIGRQTESEFLEDQAYGHEIDQEGDPAHHEACSRVELRFLSCSTQGSLLEMANHKYPFARPPDQPHGHMGQDRHQKNQKNSHPE
jgi:hypothetical protein